MNTAIWIMPIAAISFLTATASAAKSESEGEYTIKYAEIKPAAKKGYVTVQFKERKVTLEQLLKELKAPDANTRKDALRAIQWPDRWPKADRKVLIKALGELAKDKEGGIRFTACESLGYIGTDAVDVLPALTQAAKDENPLIRSRALGAIAKIGPEAKAAVPSLIMALEDKEPLIAGIASLALGNIGADSVPALIKALDSPKPAVREQAVEALSIVGPDAKEAIPALKRLLTDPSERIRMEARYAIDDIEERPGRTIRIHPGQLRRPKEAPK